MQDKQLLKEALKKYNKDDYYILSWDEYQSELDTLTKKIVEYVNKNKINIDAVVPILRGGNIPATYLVYTLSVLHILPVQYKYFFIDKKRCELRRLFTIKKESIHKDNPTFLLIEGNHCYGNQARYAAKDLKSTFPNCRIIYGASNMDYNYQDVVKDAEISFYGSLTNACKELTNKECESLGLEYKKEPIFPWEKVNEEWEIVELKQHKYNNLEEIQANSKLVAEYDLS